MKQRIRHLTKSVAAAAMLAVTATSTQAQTVQYATLYSFTGLAGSYSATISNTYGAGANTATLTFTGQPVTTVTGPTFMD